jgi:hypothetical protein
MSAAISAVGGGGSAFSAHKGVHQVHQTFLLFDAWDVYGQVGRHKVNCGCREAAALNVNAAILTAFKTPVTSLQLHSFL